MNGPDIAPPTVMNWKAYRTVMNWLQTWRRNSWNSYGLGMSTQYILISPHCCFMTVGMKDYTPATSRSYADGVVSYRSRPPINCYSTILILIIAIAAKPSKNILERYARVKGHG